MPLRQVYTQSLTHLVFVYNTKTLPPLKPVAYAAYMAPTVATEWKQLKQNLRSPRPWLALAALVAHAYTLHLHPLQWAAFGVLAFFLVFLATEDFKSQTLPNLLTLPMGLAGLVLSVVGIAPATPHNALLGIVVGGVFFLFIAVLSLKLLNKPGMGVGDIKLLAAGGAWTGVTGLPLVLVIASVAALAYIMATRVGRGQKFPFGPFLAAGIWGVVMYQDVMWTALFNLMLITATP